MWWKWVELSVTKLAWTQKHYLYKYNVIMLTKTHFLMKVMETCDLVVLAKGNTEQNPGRAILSQVYLEIRHQCYSQECKS